MAWITAAVTGVQRGKDSVTYGLKGDWAGSLVNGLALGGKVAEALFKRQASEAFKKATEAAAKKVGLPTPTYIIDAMMLAINLVALLNGFGDERASSISTAKEQLENVKLQLEAAIPDSRDWSGDAADAYVKMVDQLTAFVNTLQTTDKEFQAYVVNQADSVKKANMCISYSTLALIASYIPALALYAVPLIGAELSLAYQIIAAFAVGAAVFAMEMMTLANSMSVSNQLNSTIATYNTLGTSVVNDMAGDFGSLEETTKALRGQTTVLTSSKLSSFRGISDGLSAFSFAGITVSKLADQSGSGVSDQQRALLSASDAKAAAAKTSTDTPAKATDKTTTPAATPSSFTPPTLAQMGQMSQGLNQFGQTFSQGAQQISQLAQQAKTAAPTAAPAGLVSDVKGDDGLTDEERDKKKKDEEAAGAASGTGGAGAVPIDTAAPAPAAAAAPAGRERVL